MSHDIANPVIMSQPLARWLGALPVPFDKRSGKPKRIKLQRPAILVATYDPRKLSVEPKWFYWVLDPDAGRHV